MRQARHFHYLRINPLEKEAQNKLYQTQIQCIFKDRGYNSEVYALRSNVVDAVVKIVEEMRNFLKPKPNTPHYSFTNREVWNIIDCLGLSNKGSC